MPNNVASWVSWQVLVQGDHAGVCLLCLMTWENSPCRTGPRWRGTPCTGAAESDWEGCSRRPELSSQTWALTWRWLSDSHRPHDNVRVERQSQGNYVGPLWSFQSCIIIFVHWLSHCSCPGASLSLYIHSSHRHQVSPMHHTPGPYPGNPANTVHWHFASFCYVSSGASDA